MKPRPSITTCVRQWVSFWLLAAGSVAAPAADAQTAGHAPVGWRGDGSGCLPTAQPLTQWNTNTHLRWQAEVGTGQSSPIVVADRIFLTAEPDVLLCLEAATGRDGIGVDRESRVFSTTRPRLTTGIASWSTASGREAWPSGTPRSTS